MNWRSQKRIVDFLNKIRSKADGLEQFNNREKCQGVLRVYIRADNTENKRQEEEDIKKDFQKYINIEDDKVYHLILEHRMAATRSGFEKVYKSLHKEPTKKILEDASGKEMYFLKNILLKLYIIYENQDEYSLLKMLRDYKILNNKGMNWKELKSIARKFNEFFLLFDNIESLTMQECIIEINKLGIIDVPEILIKGGRGEVSPRSENWIEAIKSPFIEFVNYFNYIDKIDGYITQQGSKGLEYNNVMVIMNDIEKRGNQFSFEKFFGTEGLSIRDKDNIEEGKDNCLNRTERLFYVAASRARESLALVIYTRNVQQIKDYFIENELAEELEINLV